MYYAFVAPASLLSKYIMRHLLASTLLLHIFKAGLAIILQRLRKTLHNSVSVLLNIGASIMLTIINELRS